MQADICRRDFIKSEGEGGGRRSAKGGASIKQLSSSPRGRKRIRAGEPGPDHKKIKIEKEVDEEKVVAGYRDLALALQPFVREKPELFEEIVNIIKGHG